MGVYSSHDWLENAYRGAPLGEMVQWSDLIASLYVLGHNVTVTADPNEMKRYAALSGSVAKVMWWVLTSLFRVPALTNSCFEFPLSLQAGVVLECSQFNPS